MLIRLFLAMVLALGAMPMAVPCHGTVPSPHAAAAMRGCDHPAPASDHRDHHGAPAEQGCIGCAALDDWLAERVAAPVATPALGPADWQPRLALRAAAPPTLRPPRAG